MDFSVSINCDHCPCPFVLVTVLVNHIVSSASLSLLLSSSLSSSSSSLSSVNCASCRPCPCPCYHCPPWFFPPYCLHPRHHCHHPPRYPQVVIILVVVPGVVVKASRWYFHRVHYLRCRCWNPQRSLCCRPCMMIISPAWSTLPRGWIKTYCTRSSYCN